MNQKPELQEFWSSPSEKVIFLFKSIQKIYRDMIFEKSSQYGFTGPQFGLIFVLYKNPYLTLNEMSEFLGLSKSTVSGIVDRLVGQGVVIREIPENNRRSVRLSLSHEFLNNNILEDICHKYITDIFQDAGEDELEKIICGLEILYTLLKEKQNNDPN